MDNGKQQRSSRKTSLYTYHFQLLAFTLNDSGGMELRGDGNGIREVNINGSHKGECL